jgi:hypothetical protein
MTKKQDLIPSPTETQIMAQVVQLLTSYGVELDRQNTGGTYNDNGQYVPFGRPGNTDLAGMLTSGPGRGKRLEIEIKREGFDPTKVSGVKAKAHWARQVARMNRTNAQGGYAFWCTDASQALHVLKRINDGWRVVLDEQGWPHVTDEDISDGVQA